MVQLQLPVAHIHLRLDHPDPLLYTCLPRSPWAVKLWLVGQHTKQGRVSLRWFKSLSIYILPFIKSVFMVTNQGKQSFNGAKRACSHLAEQPGCPLNSATEPKEHSSHFAMFPLLSNSMGWPQACPFDLSACRVQSSSIQDAKEEVGTKAQSI